MKKKIIFAGYPAEYFLMFSKGLELNNYEIYWITALKSDYTFLIKNGVRSDFICDVSKTAMDIFDTKNTFLEKIERNERPYINDIILMDRNLRHIKWTKSRMYLNFVAQKTSDFLININPTLITSWRDTAVQMTVLKVAKTFNYSFVIPTRYRIPNEFYGFCSDFETNSFIKIINVDDSHIQWATNIFRQIETIKPELKVSARTFIDVLRLIPSHSKAFYDLLTKLMYDAGNKYNRYGIEQIFIKYLKRRLRLIIYKIFNPGSKQVDINSNYVFFPLHTQPESSIDVQASLYSNQVEFIKNICRVLPHELKLYVKVHPTDVDGQPLSFFRKISKIPGAILVDYNFPSSDLISNASCIITMTGTAGIEAALKGIPVITFSNNFYNEFPTVKQAKGFEHLQELLKTESLNILRSLYSTKEIIQIIATWKANGFIGEVSRAYGSNPKNLSCNDIEELVKTYNILIKSIDG